MFQNQESTSRPRRCHSRVTRSMIHTIANRRKLHWLVLLPVATSMPLLLQCQELQPMPSQGAAPVLSQNVAEVAEILGLRQKVDRLFRLQGSRTCDATPQLEEVVARQEIVQRIETVALDLDGALGEIANEQSKLSNLRSGLQARRDRTQGYLNAASLITGSGIGIAVNATQLNDSSAIAGDVLGIASGSASTLLSIIAIKKQNGPSKTVGNIPNMLGPLFDRGLSLHTYYPPEVMAYLESSARSDGTVNDSRLAQLKASWIDAGDIGSAGDMHNSRKIEKVATSGHDGVKLTISDLTDRIAMLGDVAGRMSLMKRDMAALMRTIEDSSSKCSSVP